MVQNQKNTFPDTYENTPLEILLKAYNQGPGRIKKCIEGLTEEDLKKRVIDNKWSIFEIVLHVVDSELVGAVRIRQCYSQSDTRFPFYNQEIWTDVFEYQEQSKEYMRKALNFFENLRETTGLIFRKCTGDDWHKTGFHPESGEITLRNLLELYSDHSERHIEQILDRRDRLEKPVDFPMILTERLY